jgi:hypothetical protein
MDLTDARSGEVELLVEGTWVLAEWCDHAWDGSPTGTTGFADITNAYLMIPEDVIEDWRPGDWTTWSFIEAVSDPMARGYLAKCVSTGVPIDKAIEGYASGISYEYLTGVVLPA